MYKFVILAVADISKSIQNAKDEDKIQQNQRNMAIAESDERDANEPHWNRPTLAQGRLKFILKPQRTLSIISNAEELITAFEYDGSIVKRSGREQKSLVGCILQVDSALDICRGILLLKAADCQVYDLHDNNTTRVNTTSITTNVYIRNHHMDNGFTDSVIDDELMAEIFNEHDEEFLFD